MDSLKRLLCAFFLFFIMSSPVFSLSYLLPTQLIVSTNVFVVKDNTVGLNVVTPNALFDIHAYPGNTTLMLLTTAGRLGIKRSVPSQNIDVSGNVRLSSDGGVNYYGSYYGQTNRDWRLVQRDDCNTYSTGDTSTGWKNYVGASYTTVTTFNGYNILGGYQSSSTTYMGTNSGTNYYVYKDYNLPVHTYAKVIVEYYAIDSWGGSSTVGEMGFVKCTDPNASTMMFEWTGVHSIVDPPSGAVPPPLVSYGGMSGTTAYDVVLTGVAQGYHTGTTLRVYVGSFLDEAVSNESFGIGSVEIWVR